MKTYVLREGSKFTLIQATPSRMLVTPCVADRDICFDGNELVRVDTIIKLMIFHVGNRHYYANVDSVTVVS